MRLLLALLTLLPLAGAANHGALRNPNDRFWLKHSPARYRVLVETSRGAFVLEVHRDWAPSGADRFYNLVRAGFYDDSRFYRVTARFANVGQTLSSVNTAISHSRGRTRPSGPSAPTSFAEYPSNAARPVAVRRHTVSGNLPLNFFSIAT